MDARLGVIADGLRVARDRRYESGFHNDAIVEWTWCAYGGNLRLMEKLDQEAAWPTMVGHQELFGTLAVLGSDLHRFLVPLVPEAPGRG